MLNKLGLLTMFLTFFNPALQTDEQIREQGRTPEPVQWGSLQQREDGERPGGRWGAAQRVELAYPAVWPALLLMSFGDCRQTHSISILARR